MQRIAVGVYDEHEVYRRGLASCIAEDDGLTVVDLGPAVPDSLPELDVAVVAPRAIAERRPPCPLVVCAFPGARARALLADANVHAVLDRQLIEPRQLVSAVRAAAVGLRIADPHHLDRRLDERSRAVLLMLADGSTTRDIATTLGYSERTIKAVISDLERDLDARSRTQAVVTALRREII